MGSTVPQSKPESMMKAVVPETDQMLGMAKAKKALEMLALTSAIKGELAVVSRASVGLEPPPLTEPSMK